MPRFWISLMSGYNEFNYMCSTSNSFTSIRCSHNRDPLLLPDAKVWAVCQLCLCNGEDESLHLMKKISFHDSRESWRFVTNPIARQRTSFKTRAKPEQVNSERFRNYRADLAIYFYILRMSRCHARRRRRRHRVLDEKFVTSLPLISLEWICSMNEIRSTHEMKVWKTETKVK